MLAISDRWAGVRAFARAGPPFVPAVLARFANAVCSRSHASPVAISVISFASWFGSRGRFGGLDIARRLFQVDQSHRVAETIINVRVAADVDQRSELGQ